MMGRFEPVAGAVILMSRGTLRPSAWMVMGEYDMMGVGELTGMSAAPPRNGVFGNSIVKLRMS